MKVKVNGTLYDGAQRPIMVILSEADKENIRRMAPDADRYASFPDGYDADAARRFMEDRPRL